MKLKYVNKIEKNEDRWYLVSLFQNNVNKIEN